LNNSLINFEDSNVTNDSFLEYSIRFFIFLEKKYFGNFNISENNIISVELAPKYYGIVLGLAKSH
jgi:hypothetical protein